MKIRNNSMKNIINYKLNEQKKIKKNETECNEPPQKKKNNKEYLRRTRNEKV